MRETIPYLTDEELDCFIREIETDELVLAPADILDDILEKVQRERIRNREKIKAYKKYRFRVIATVAAAVFVILVLPNIESSLWKQTEMQENPPTRETQLVWINEDTSSQADDRKIIGKWFGGTTIFAKEDKYRLFR